MQTINVAIVGLGFMGATHIKSWLKVPGARIAGICDAYRLPVDGDLSNITGNLGDNAPVKLDMSTVRATKDMQDLLGDPGIDIIDLCVPTLAHPKLAIAALRAGKHVICEKPMARTSAQAREMTEAAEASKGFFLPAMVLRFMPEWGFLKKAIEAHDFGRVLAARFRRVADLPKWSADFIDGRKSGGALLDLHIHDADFIQHCFGRPSAVCAKGFTKLSGEIDYVTAQYTVASGAVVSAEGTWAMTDGFGFNMAYTVLFENATIDYDFARGAEALRVVEKGKPWRIVNPEGEDGYTAELAYMADCVRHGRKPAMVTARDALGAIELVEAEGRSIQEGRPVSV